MVFNENIDKSLYLILKFDWKHRDDIAKLIYDIPMDLIVKIQNLFRENEDGFDSVELCKAVRDNDNITSMYRILVFNNGLRIKLSRWNNQDEWIYDLELCDVNLDEYIGSYFYSSSGLFLGIGPVIVVSDGIGYELFEDNFGNKVMELSGNKVNTKVIDKSLMIDEFCLDDLSSKKNINRLVRGKRR